ncbi:hypothetical protein A2U01_0098621, partial [Trifolium medium]|nr:hypothetical protein [Trifolium medium]
VAQIPSPVGVASAAGAGATLHLWFTQALRSPLSVQFSVPCFRTEICRSVRDSGDYKTILAIFRFLELVTAFYLLRV